MSELPTSWAWAPLAAVTSDAVQKEPAAKEQFFYIDIGSVDRNTKQISWPQALVGNDAPSRARKLIRVGDTLVSMTRPILNAVALVPEHLDGQIASTGFDVLRPCGVDPRWLIYLVRTQAFIDDMSSLVKGALYPAVRSKDVRGYLVPVAPSNEQKRIADQLDSLIARVNACNDRFDGIPAILKRLRQSLLAAATSGELTEDFRVATQSNEVIGAFPAEWTPATVGSVANDLRYGTSKKCQYSETGIGVLRIPNISENGRIDARDLKRAHFDTVELKKLALKPGDLLIIRSNGSVDLVGKTCVVSESEKGLLFAGYLIRLRLNTSVVLPAFMRMCLAEPVQRQRIEQASKSTSGVNNINADELRALPVWLPPIAEQAEIVRRVESLFAIADRLEAQCTTARAQVARLTPLLLAKAFRGELVPQDPADEPASELLARLCQRRADNSAGSSKRRGAKPGYASVARSASSA